MPAGEVGHAGVDGTDGAPRAGRVDDELGRDRVSRGGRRRRLLERPASAAEEPLRGLLLHHRLRREVLVAHEEVDALLTTERTLIGRRTRRSKCSSNDRSTRRRLLGGQGRSAVSKLTPSSAMPGRSLTRCAVPSRSDDQRCCHAPPGPGARRASRSPRRRRARSVEGSRRRRGRLPGSDHHDLHAFWARHHRQFRRVRSACAQPGVPGSGVAEGRVAGTIRAASRC